MARAQRSRTIVSVILVVLLLGACAAGESSEREALAERVIDELEQGYFTDAPEWAAALEQAKAELADAPSITAMYPIFKELTKVAGGTHSRFLTPDELEAALAPFDPDQPFAVPEVTYHEGIATLTVPTFGSDSQASNDRFEDAASAIYRDPQAAQACGWIIDLRENSGGDAFEMLSAVAPLIDDGTVLTFRERDGDGENVIVSGTEASVDGTTYARLDASIQKLPGRPVALLQSGRTASAAEAVLVGFAGQPDVRRFGATSHGFASANEGIDLPEGSRLIITTAFFEDRNGATYERGIVPNVRTRLGGSALLDAQAWLAEQCAD